MTDPHTWWFLENTDGRWLENIDHGAFTDDPNQALKWPNEVLADQIRRGLRWPLWTLKATEHMWVEPTLPPPEDAWRPIETAPKDGTIIDVWAFWPEHGDASRVPDAYFTNDDWKLGQYYARQFLQPPQVTHWRPSPAPPGQVSPPPEDEGVKGLEAVVRVVQLYNVPDLLDELNGRQMSCVDGREIVEGEYHDASVAADKLRSALAIRQSPTGGA